MHVLGSRRAVVLCAAVVVLGALGGCRSSDSGAIALDGSPRVPDREGVVASVDRHHLKLEGGPTLTLSPKLQAFSTYNRHTISVLGTRGAYVHLGLDGDTVQWLARIAVVQRTKADGKKIAIYQGQLRKVDGERLEFADGTVLRLAKGLEVTGPIEPGRSVVVIDAVTLRVQGITLPQKPAQTTTTRAG